MKNGTRVSLIAVSVSLALIITFAVNGQRRDSSEGKSPEMQWEYLVVSGGSSNISTAGNENYPNMKKQPDSSFREFFPLERNFDKLGTKGWELVSVYGPPNDPVYFFKRLKEAK